MSILAVIPSRYEPQRLTRLVRSVAYEADVLVLDNGHEHLPWLPAQVWDVRGRGLYEMWNIGKHAAESYDYCAILNDDVIIGRGVLTRLVDVLASDSTLGIAYPGDGRIVRSQLGPYRMTGFAFAFPTTLAVEFDETWRWWCGDSAFERDVLRSGLGVAGVSGCPIEHESDAERDNWARRPELREWAAQDERRWAAIIAQQKGA